MLKLNSLSIILTLLGLAPCFTLAQSPETGIEGVISISPIQGGPARQGDPESAPLANATFIVAKNGEPVASFETDSQGRFQIPLPPGHYLVSKKDWKGKGGSYGPFEVDIVAGQVKKVSWICDSGLR